MKYTHSFLIATLLILNTYVHAQTKDVTSTARGSDKVDLKKLEEKYWSAKDDDYGVIQNRTFAKAQKFYLSAVYGPLINDPFVKSRALGAMLGYYFSEDFGAELSYMYYDSKKNETIERLNRSSGLTPNYNMIQSTTTFSATYTPFYAKMAFMNKAILYFDMGFTAGLGMTTYQQVQSPDTGSANTDILTSKSTPHFELGFMQQLFINKNLAFRIDLKNTVYTQKVIPYQVNSNTTTGEETKFGNDTTLTIGATFFTN